MVDRLSVWPSYWPLGRREIIDYIDNDCDFLIRWLFVYSHRDYLAYHYDVTMATFVPWKSDNQPSTHSAATKIITTITTTGFLIQPDGKEEDVREGGSSTALYMNRFMLVLL